MAILPFWIVVGARSWMSGLARAGRADQGYVLRSGRAGRAGGINQVGYGLQSSGQDTGS